MRYRALIEYDGTDYFGFQRQLKQFPTIQGELEKALAQLAEEPVTITGAGRTDRGVHASGQVVSFDLGWRHGAAALQRAINTNLPPDIVIPELQEAEPDFHPRFDAKRRAYKYYIYNAAERSPIRRRQSWHVKRPLNLTQMNQAAASLIGEHDFATFGQPPQGTNTVREVFRAEWQKQEPFLVFTIQANAFLYRMVRSLVGSLKLVGDGSWQVSQFVDAFRDCDRSLCGMVAPPSGLFLVEVTYSG
ncbi:MAG: tRNA pseudouridine(38-40) synthase TruA [Anaerolineae bacterium]